MQELKKRENFTTQNYARDARKNTGIYRGALVPALSGDPKKSILIFNVKKFYAKIWTVLKMYTWNIPHPLSDF